VGDACGYEPETSLARGSWATFGLHWREPLENTSSQTEMARAGLLQYGELQGACFTYIASLAALFDAAPTLEFFTAEVTAAREFAKRTGDHHADVTFQGHLRLIRSLTGER
jgi:hypothetical protein